jgi:P4 family phage/plasmid primase-like protien
MKVYKGQNMIATNKTPKNKIIEINKDDNDFDREKCETDGRLKIYLDCLSTEYFDDYDLWLSIGAIIFNESNNFNLFDEYSKKSKKYNKESIIKMWNSYKQKRKKKATINRLIEMAMESDGELYINAYCNDVVSIFDDIFKDVNDTNIGYLFCYYANGNYIYDTINKQWYKFNKFGIWKKYDSDKVKLDIVEKLLPIIKNEYNVRSKNIDNENESKKLYESLNRCTSFIKKNRNREQILITMKGKLGNDLIFQKFDDVDNDLIGFENGIYDLKTFTFRIGKKEDYVTCTTGYDYDNKINKDTSKKVYQIFNDIMPNEEERIYLLKTISLGIIGRNIMEEFYIWIGTGANGKGLLRDMIAQTLGDDYFDSMEINYLENNNHGVHANNADNIMAKKKNTRLCITTEPEGDVNLKCAKLKQVSGNDKVQCRFNYGKLFNFVPKFKLIIQTNLDFRVEGYDGGIRRRLKLIKFPIKFVDEPISEFQRKINRNLKTEVKTDEFKLSFMQILIKHYKLFVENDDFKLVLPPRILEDTNYFLDENDPINKFINDELIITNNEKDRVKSSVMYDTFKSNFSYDSSNVSQMKFKTVLSNKDIHIKRFDKGMFYYGIKLKKEE